MSKLSSDLPVGWKQGRAEDFFQLQRGYDLTEVQAKPGIIPVVSSGGIAYFHNVAMVEPPGVITGRKGRLGIVYYLDRAFWPHDTTLWVKDFRGNEPKFIKILLESLHLETLDAATSVPTLNRNNVHSLTVSVPPLPEQRKIVEILGTWDEAIHLIESLIEALQRRKKALMQLLLTGEVRFPEFTAKWSHVKLGTLLSERREAGYVELPLVSITSNSGIVYRDTLDRRDTSNEDKSKYLRIWPGDIGYNTMRMWQGVSSVSQIEGIVSPAYTICVPREGVDAQFMGYLFKTPFVINKFRSYSQGLVDDTLSLKFDNFAEIAVSVPDIAEQKRIAEVLSTCDTEIQGTQEYKATIVQQKRGLMQQLLTGKIRVQSQEV